MIKFIFLSLFLLTAHKAVSQSEELSGPPAVFAIETHENLEDEDVVLPFLDMGSSVSPTSVSDVTLTTRSLIEPSDFVAKIRFVNRRSNRTYDMVYDSAEIEKQLEAEALIQAMSSVDDEALDVSDTSDVSQTANFAQKSLSGLIFKNLNVEVKQCIQDYEGVYGNDTAFVEVKDINSHDAIFSGWVYKKRPSVHVFEHPVYSMYLISCK